MPLYFMQARTMLGDVVTMASLSLAFSGLIGALFDEAKSGSSRQTRLRTLLIKLGWLALGLVGLFAGYMCRGIAIGVMVPLLSAGFSWLVIRLGEKREAPRYLEDTIGAASLAFGLIAAWFSISLVVGTSPDAPLPRALALVLLKKANADATFDRTIRHLGHALFPWSAFLPFAIGRLFRAPVELEASARRREMGVRIALLVGGSVAFATYAALAPHVTFVPFSGVVLFAGIAGVAVADFDRGAPPSRALALGTTLFAVLLYRDILLEPARIFSVFEVDKPAFPKSFEEDAARAIRISAVSFAAFVGLSFFESQPDELPSSFSSWLGDMQRTYKRALENLSQIWNGNLFFAMVVVEAALVGLGAMLFLGSRFGWASVQRLPRNFIDIGLNLWWGLPLLCLIAPFALFAIRDAFRQTLGYLRLPRSVGVFLGALVAGSILSFGYFPALAAQLSPKEVFDAYAHVQKPGEPLALLGVRARSIAYYHHGGDVTSYTDPGEAFAWLTADQARRWLIVKADDLPKLNSMHRRHAGKNLPVIDARSSQILLVSSDLAGQTNMNPLGSIVLDNEPAPAHPIDAMFEDELSLFGWVVRDATGSVVEGVIPQRKYQMRLFFRVMKPIAGSWKSFLHIDGFQRRYNGDHSVVDGKYAMNLWLPNDVIVDDYTFELEPNFTPGDYTVYVGFFSGETRFRVTKGQHHENRVILGALHVR